MFNSLFINGWQSQEEVIRWSFALRASFIPLRGMSFSCHSVVTMNDGRRPNDARTQWAQM